MTCPTNEQLARMTDEQILGPPGGVTAEHLAAHYPVQLVPYTAEEAEAFAADHDPGAASAVEGACWIDLERRRLVNMPGCGCDRPQ